MSEQIRNEHQEVLAWFKENFPLAFPYKAKDIKPLQLGIIDSIWDLYDRLTYPPFSKKRLRAGLSYYTASPSYLLAQKEGVMRVDLFGFEVEPVTKEQADHALMRYENRYKQKKSNVVKKRVNKIESRQEEIA